MPTATGFALLLETACESFEILDRIITRKTTVASDNQRDNVRDPARIQMALAKDFLFNAMRAYRVCERGAGLLELDREERKRFLRNCASIRAVRDVNEHGYEPNSASAPRMHVHPSVRTDETSLSLVGPKELVMGPLNLYDVYCHVARMRAIAGFHALSQRGAL